MTRKEPEPPPDEIKEEDLEKVVGGVSKVPHKRPSSDLVKSVERWLATNGTSDASVDQYPEPKKS